MNVDEMTQKLLEDLGFGQSSEEQKMRILAKLQQSVDEEILYVSLSRLSEEQFKKIEAAIAAEPDLPDEQKAQKMVELIRTEIPDYESVIARAISNLYDRLKDDSETVSAYLKSTNFTEDKADEATQTSATEPIAAQPAPTDTDAPTQTL